MTLARTAVALLSFAALGPGCREPALSTPVPDFAVGGGPTGGSAPAIFRGGETFSWDVSVRKISVGRLDLVVGGEGSVSASLDQNRMSRNFRPATVELGAKLDRVGFPYEADEDVHVLGKRLRTNQRFEPGRVHWQRGAKRGHHAVSTVVHSPLTAIGALRGPSLPKTMLVAAGVALYELSFSVPAPETIEDRAVVRIDAEARELGEAKPTALISVWLSDESPRTPVRLDVEMGRVRLVAKLRH